MKLICIVQSGKKFVYVYNYEGKKYGSTKNDGYQ